jgi:hypothetical protein
MHSGMHIEGNARFQPLRGRGDAGATVDILKDLCKNDPEALTMLRKATTGKVGRPRMGRGGG